MAKIETGPELDRYVAFLYAQKLPLELTCKPWKPARRLTANAYLWAYVYEPLIEATGSVAEPEEWHEFFCIKKFGGVPYIKPNGEEGVKPRRTTTKNEIGDRDVLKGDAFNDFLVFVESECAKKGVFIERGPV